MKSMFTLLSAMLLAPLAAMNVAAAVPSKPNILLILADDLGYGDVSCYNDRAKVSTPNLDRLSREGMRFTDAHSPATVCTPARYSLMTGQMAFRVPRGGTVFTGIGGPSLIAPGRATAVRGSARWEERDCLPGQVLARWWIACHSSVQSRSASPSSRSYPTAEHSGPSTGLRRSASTP